MTTSIIVTLVVSALLGWSMGKTSNGMTSPRTAFTIFIGPLCAIIGLVIGLIAGLTGGNLAGQLLGNALAGAVAGWALLGLARLTR